MKLVLKFSGEHPSLPRAELECVLVGEGIDYRILRCPGDGKIILLEVDAESTDFLERLALTKKAALYIGSSNILKYVAQMLETVLPKDKTFCVRGYSNKIDVELGEILHKKGYTVDLQKPDCEVSLFKFDGITAGINIPLVRDFESRKPQFRPFFHPTSLHPKLARALVNLACVKRGDILFDPFCGTGGILIEAGLCGMNAEGLDVDEKMVEGCRRNLAHYGLRGKLKEGDALKIMGRYKAIVTDPPYGRGSYAKGKDARKLVKEFVGKAHKNLAGGGRLVIVAPRDLRIKNPDLTIVDKFDVRVHKSLTRRIWVYEKK